MNQTNLVPKATLFRVASKNLVISASGAVLSYLSFMLVAYMFGATVETDIFMFASSFVLVVAALITTVFGAMFLPLYIKLLHKDDDGQRAARFADAMLLRLLVVACMGGALVFFFPVQLFSVVSRLNQGALKANAHVLTYFSLIFFLTLLNEFLRVLLQAREAFVPAALSSVLQPAVNVFCVWILASTYGYEALAIAAAGSRLSQCLFLLWHVRSLGLRLRLSLVHSTDIAEFVRVARPYWLASIISTASVFFYDYVASGLPAGSLTAVAFAQKIYLLPISLLALPVIEVLNTRMSTLYARNEMDALGSLYALSIKVAVWVMLPIGLLIAFHAGDVTSILLSRGAYSEDSRSITEHSLVIFALTIPLIAIFSVNGRIPLVLQNAHLSSLIGSGGQMATIAVVWVMVRSQGYIGLSVTKLLMEAAFFLPFGFLIVRLYMPDVDFRSIGKEGIKIVLAAVLCLAVPYGLRLTPMGLMGPLVFVVTAVVGYGLAYVLLCWVMRLDSLHALGTVLRQRATGPA